MNKKNNKPIILLILISLVLFGCSKKFTNQKIGEQPIKIGATLALSGKYAYIGEGYLNGLLLAVEEINMSGGVNGRQIELLVEDDKGEPKAAAQNVNKLISADSVEIIFSAFTPTTEAVKQIVADHNKILFYAAIESSIARDYPFAFKDYYDAYDNGALMAEASHNLGYKKVVFLRSDRGSETEIEQGFIHKAANVDLEIVDIEIVPGDETDFKTHILKAFEKKTDACITTITFNKADIFMKQFKELGLLSTPVVHAVAPFLPSGDTAEMRKIYEENKSISTWYGVLDNPTQQKQIEFVEKYKQRFGKKPLADSAYTYDDIYILARSIEACDGKIETTQDKGCVADYLRTIKYEGVGGYLEFDEDGVSNREIFLIRVEDGEWAEVKLDEL